MSYPQFYLGQKVTYKQMPSDPPTALTITNIKQGYITAELPGGSKITANISSFRRYVPEEVKEYNEGNKQKIKSYNKKYHTSK